MTSRRLLTGYIALSITLLITLVICVSRCQGQVVQKQLYDGYIAITDRFIYLTDVKDSVRYNLEVLKVDTVFRQVIVTVISSDGLGFITVNELGLTYHFKTDEGRRSRMKRFNFIKQ